MRVRIVLTALVILGMMATLQVAASGGGDAEAGKLVFKKKCAMCHSQDGTGNEKMAKMLKVEIRDLGSAEVQTASDEDIAKVIAEGKGKMKPVKGLEEADVTNVIAFIRTLKK